MEPRREEQQKKPEPGGEPKFKRFRIIKLEERIAPSNGGKGGTQGNKKTCGCTDITICPIYSIE